MSEPYEDENARLRAERDTWREIARNFIIAEKAERRAKGFV